MLFIKMNRKDVQMRACNLVARVCQLSPIYIGLPDVLEILVQYVFIHSGFDLHTHGHLQVQLASDSISPWPWEVALAVPSAATVSTIVLCHFSAPVL